MAIHFNILTWETPGTEGPGGLQPTVSQRIGYDLAAQHVNMQLQSPGWRCGVALGSHLLFLFLSSSIARNVPSSSRHGFCCVFPPPNSLVTQKVTLYGHRVTADVIS